MSTNDHSISLKNKFLRGVSALALAVAVAAAGSLAISTPARAQTVIDDAATINADDAAGISFIATDDGANAATVTIDISGGSITLGVDATNAFVNNSADGDVDDNLTLNITGANTVTFADDVISGNNNSEGTIAIVVGSTDVASIAVFQGNITDNNAAAATITLGNASGAETQTVTFDTAFAENLTIAAAIDDDNAGTDDTSVINIQNTDTGARTITFSDVIGTTQQIDTINIGGDGNDITVVFNAATDAADINIGSADGSSATVTFATTVDSTTIDIGNGGVTADTIVVNFAVAGDTNVTGNIEGAATDTETINITDTDNGTDDDQVNFAGTIGAATAVDAINVGSATLSGTADFAANVSTTTLTILGGDAGGGNEDSAVFFSGSTLTAAVVLDDGSDTATLTFDNFGAQTMTGAITAQADNEGILTIANQSVGTAAFSTVGATGTDIATLNISSGVDEGTASFSGAVFATTVNVGNASNMQGTAGSVATFSSTVAATTMNVTGGTGAAAEAASVTFTGTPTITTLNVISGTGDDASDALATFNSATVSVTTITLEENSAARTATLTFSGGAAQAVSSAIDGATAEEGTVNVLAGTNLVTFAGVVGNSAGQGIRVLNVGNAATAGNAEFDGTVDAATITITTNEAGDAVANFDAAVLATNIAITSGDTAGDLASATFAGNVTAATAITLNNGAGGDNATATFDGTTAQTVVGNIVAASDGEGLIAVTNTAGVTFRDNLGVAATGLASMTITSGATLTQRPQDATNDDLTFDVVGNVDNGAGGTGGTLVLQAGTATTVLGGDITLATITGTSNLTAITVQGGTGGAAAAGGVVGGAVVDTAFVGAQTVGTFTFQGGAGGSGIDDDTSSDAGNGGAVAASTVTGLIAGNVVITGGNAGTAGAGGAAQQGGDAGTGGLVVVTDLTGGITGNLTMTSGNASAGGAGGTAGAGGAAGNGGVVTLTDVSTGTITGNVTIASGSAGNGGIAATANNGANGGNGGAVTVSDITAAITGNVTITGADGGDGATSNTTGDSGDGGNGGAVTTTFSGAIAGNVALTAGDGGDGGAAGSAAGDGGDGGTGSSVTASIEANVGGTITLNDGEAGTAGAADTGTFGAAGTAGTVTLNFTGGAAQAVTGAVTAAADGEGTINIRNVNATGVTFGSNVGASGAGLLALNVGDGTAAGDGVFNGAVTATTITLASTSGDSTADFNGNVTGAVVITDGVSANLFAATFAGNVTGTIAITDAGGDDATLTFDGATAQTVSGAVTAAADNAGQIILANAAGVTFSSTIGVLGTEVAAVTVNANTSATFSGAVNANAITVNGTATFGENANLADTTLTIPANATIIVGSNVAAGETVLAATAVVMGGGAGTVGLQMPSNFSTGTIVLINDDDDDDISAEVTDFNVTDTVLVNYTVQSTGGDASQIEVVASKNSAASIASSLGVTTAAASALDNGVTAAANDAAALAAYTTALNTGGTAAKLAAEQSQNSPSALTATSVVAAAVGTRVFGVGVARLASLRTGAAYASAAGTGFATGNEGWRNSVWLRPFTYIADQDARSGIAGYDAKTFGVAAGADVKFGEADNWTAGLALSYANSDIDGEGAGNSDTDINSYQVTVYGDYTTSGWYVEGLVGYAYNSVDTARQITFGGLTRTAKGDYNADQYMARIGTGRPIKVGSNSFLTPSVGFQYTHVANDSYTETGAGALNLTVNPEDIDIALGIVGARYHVNVPTEKGIVTPEIRGSVSYDFAGDEAQSTSTFTGGGAAFQVAGADVAELGGSIGAGLSYTTSDGRVTFGADYDAEFKADFLGHAGRIELKLHF